MDILLADKQKFFIQKGLIKDKIIKDFFKKEKIIKTEFCNFYREKSLIVVILQDIAYLCQWKDDYTIVFLKYKDKCKAKLYKAEELLHTYTIESDVEISYFCIVMDYYEFLDELAYESFFTPVLEEFSKIFY